MSHAYKVRDPDKAYFVTITTVEWIDLFTRASHKNTIVESLKHCQQTKGLEIYAWVLMSTHLHMICRGTDDHNLAYIIRDFKKFTSRQIIENVRHEPENRRKRLLELFSKNCAHLKRGQEYKVWQDGYHGEELFSNKFIYQKLNYIHQNPVEAGVVFQPEEYLYSSARNYAGMESLIDVILLPPQLIAR